MWRVEKGRRKTVEKFTSREGLRILAMISVIMISRRGQPWTWRAEEADQSFDVLSSRRQEELLTNELHPTQAQATQSNLVLEFREQGLCLYRQAQTLRCVLAESAMHQWSIPVSCHPHG